jgi:hypothetical protein
LSVEDFVIGGAFREVDFLRQAQQYDWGQFADSIVLVRGCQSTIIPPWVYMYFTGRLAGIARAVRFGNEHDNIVVYRASGYGEKD